MKIKLFQFRCGCGFLQNLDIAGDPPKKCPTHSEPLVLITRPAVVSFCATCGRATFPNGGVEYCSGCANPPSGCGCKRAGTP